MGASPMVIKIAYGYSKTVDVMAAAVICSCWVITSITSSLSQMAAGTKRRTFSFYARHVIGVRAHDDSYRNVPLL